MLEMEAGLLLQSTMAIPPFHKSAYCQAAHASAATELVHAYLIKTRYLLYQHYRIKQAQS